MNGPWKRELLWVQRNDKGVAVGISEVPPPVEEKKAPTVADPQPAGQRKNIEDYIYME